MHLDDAGLRMLQPVGAVRDPRTMGAGRRSVDVLNSRLERGWVVNPGIAGNRLLVDEIGEHALARLDRDAPATPGRGTSWCTSASTTSACRAWPACLPRVNVTDLAL
ncbi:hypothetical protein ACFQ0B_52100 [Nonomuraea thailandensis]